MGSDFPSKMNCFEMRGISTDYGVSIDAKSLDRAGHDEQRPNRGMLTIFNSESTRLFPRRSGMSKVRSSIHQG